MGDWLVVAGRQSKEGRSGRGEKKQKTLKPGEKRVAVLEKGEKKKELREKTNPGSKRKAWLCVNWEGKKGRKGKQFVPNNGRTPVHGGGEDR